jgi:hypothetical protein
VGYPIERYFKLLLSIVLSRSRPLGELSLDPQLVCFALYSPPAMNRCPRVL